jgi:hypothetical protein
LETGVKDLRQRYSAIETEGGPALTFKSADRVVEPVLELGIASRVVAVLQSLQEVDGRFPVLCELERQSQPRKRRKLVIQAEGRGVRPPGGSTNWTTEKSGVPEWTGTAGPSLHLRLSAHAALVRIVDIVWEPSHRHSRDAAPSRRSGASEHEVVIDGSAGL